jgi:hypothetical protein
MVRDASPSGGTGYQRYSYLPYGRRCIPSSKHGTFDCDASYDMQIVFEDAQLHPDRLSDEISHGLNFLELGPNLLHLTTSHRPGCIE